MIERVYGENVWKELADNGHANITRKTLPDYDDMFKALHARAHAFMISLKGAEDYFERYYDDHHRICISDTRCLPAIEAAIIGITEGTLQPMEVKKFLKDHQVSERNAGQGLPGLNRVMFAAQRKLQQAAGIVIPVKGDIFAMKTDLQPVAKAGETVEAPKPKKEPKKSSWI